MEIKNTREVQHGSASKVNNSNAKSLARLSASIITGESLEAILTFDIADSEEKKTDEEPGPSCRYGAFGGL